MTATCTNCESIFRNVDRNEDGSPAIEQERCARPGCEVYLCRAGCEHLSFRCDGCGLSLGADRFCIGCVAETLELEPECECRQTDVDMFEARGCPFHDPLSPWNVRHRAVTAVQEYDSIAKEIA
jgi:hypothetical protein